MERHCQTKVVDPPPFQVLIQAKHSQCSLCNCNLWSSMVSHVLLVWRCLFTHQAIHNVSLRGTWCPAVVPSDLCQTPIQYSTATRNTFPTAHLEHFQCYIPIPTSIITVHNHQTTTLPTTHHHVAKGDLTILRTVQNPATKIAFDLCVSTKTDSWKRILLPGFESVKEEIAQRVTDELKSLPPNVAYATVQYVQYQLGFFEYLITDFVAVKRDVP